MDLQNGLDLPADSFATRRADSLFGDSYIEIIPATADEGAGPLRTSISTEAEADATGAHMTGNPYALASALQKLDTYSKRLPMGATASTAHLFIVAPLISGASFANRGRRDTPSGTSRLIPVGGGVPRGAKFRTARSSANWRG